MGDQDTLARGETVGLDDVGSGHRVKVGKGVLLAVEHAELGRGNSGTREELLHECLGSFELGAVGARAKDGLPLGPQIIGEPVDHLLIGPDDEEIGLELRRGRRDARDAVRRDTGVPRRHDDLSALREGPRQCVFTRARANDDAAPHEGRTNCSRPGPTPTTEMVTPVVASRNFTYALALSGNWSYCVDAVMSSFQPGRTS